MKKLNKNLPYHINVFLYRPKIMNEMDTTQYNRYSKVWYNTEQRCRSTIHACPRNRGAVAQSRSVVALIESVEALIRDLSAHVTEVP